MIVANWKMNGSYKLCEEIIQNIQDFSCDEIKQEIVLSPPAIYMDYIQALAKSLLKSGKDKAVYFAGQDCSVINKDCGAYTGEISAAMLHEANCKYVILGHSERRTTFNETLEVISQKICNAYKKHLIPIICMGEDLKSFQDAQTFTYLDSQLRFICNALSQSLKDLHDLNIIIAYEPIWAIGTGRVATEEQIESSHRFILERVRSYLKEFFFTNKDLNEAKERVREIIKAVDIKILYGGSINAENILSVLSLPSVSGVLVGGASICSNKWSALLKKLNSSEVFLQKLNVPKVKNR